MTEPNAILVATDFSEASEAVMDLAVKLAKPSNATVYVLHAYEVPSVPTLERDLVGSADVALSITKAVESGLRAMIAKREGEGIDLVPIAKLGDPCRTIVATALEKRVSLICMGTHGRTGLRRVIFGSVAEGVVRTSAIPVVTVPFTHREHAGAPAYSTNMGGQVS